MLDNNYLYINNEQGNPIQVHISKLKAGTVVYHVNYGYGHLHSFLNTGTFLILVCAFGATGVNGIQRAYVEEHHDSAALRIIL